jgi:hypothetical protein
MILLMIASAAMAATDPMEARLQRAYRAAPRPVRSFLERRAGCNHWGGEEAYDAERAQQIARAVRGLRCDRLEADERRLKRQYARSRRVRWLLSATRERDIMP